MTSPSQPNPSFQIVQSEHLSPGPAAWLRERATLIECPHDSPDFHNVMAQADGLIVRTYTQVNQALIERSPQLRVVGRAGVALENIDIPACRARGIEVVHAPGSNAQAVVEYVLCLLCDALRPRIAVTSPLDSESWERVRAETFAHTQMSEMSLGILGLGRIGKRIAHVARSIGFDVYYNDIIDIPEGQRNGAQPLAPKELFARCDVISVHIDSRPGNHHFVNESLIAAMKPTALLLNTSRGLAIDHAALAAFLHANPKSRAMIDVHDPEPFTADYPLLGCSNATLLPHLAGRTETALTNMSWVVRDVLAVLQGNPPQHPAP
ncbi:MAG: NAD(P)-dependent oxidoreductase [Phycisphaerales bacterium]